MRTPIDLGGSDGATRYGSSRRSVVCLFLLLTGWYSLTSSGRLRSIDEYLAFYQTESLVLRHSSTIPQALLFHNFYGRFDRFGEPRAPYPPVQALAATPLYAVGDLAVIAARLSPETGLFLREFATTLLSAVAAAGTVAVVFFLLQNLGFALQSALATSFALALTTLLWPYSGYFFSEPVACLLLALSATVLFPKADTERSPLPIRLVLLGGGLLGGLLWVRITHAIAGAVFCCALLYARRTRDALLVAACAAVSLALILAWNHVMFGGFLLFGYPDFAEGGRRLNDFSTPLRVGLAGMLLSPGKSIFLYMPMTVLGILGLKRFADRIRALALVAVLLPLSYLFFFARYANWEGGRCPGPRYLLPALLFLCLPAAEILQGSSRRLRILPASVFALGLAVQMITMATSYLEAEVGHGYYDESYAYRLSYSPLPIQVELAWRYATHSLPQQLGLGWDRWPLFLSEAGVNRRFIGSFLLIECAAVLIFGWGLLAELRRARQEGENSVCPTQQLQQNQET